MKKNEFVSLYHSQYLNLTDFFNSSDLNSETINSRPIDNLTSFFYYFIKGILQ